MCVMCVCVRGYAKTHVSYKRAAVGAHMYVCVCVHVYTFMCVYLLNIVPYTLRDTLHKLTRSVIIVVVLRVKSTPSRTPLSPHTSSQP